MSRNYFYGCPNVDFEDVCGNPGDCNELGRCEAMDKERASSHARDAARLRLRAMTFSGPRARAREAMAHKARKVRG